MVTLCTANPWTLVVGHDSQPRHNPIRASLAWNFALSHEHWVILLGSPEPPGPILRNPVTWMTLLVWIQFILGVATLLLHTPLTLAALHQLTAFLLLSVVTILVHRTTKAMNETMQI